MTAFFPYNPRRSRALFLAGALACVLMTIWAVWGARRQTERFGEARAGVSAGLVLAFSYAFVRLRPRQGWGIALEDDALVLSRPLTKGELRIPKEAVRNVERPGAGARTLLVYVGTEGERAARLAISRHLFASDSAFELLAEALKTWKPPRRLDA
jgi:hypothetical protein